MIREHALDWPGRLRLALGEAGLCYEIRTGGTREDYCGRLILPLKRDRMPTMLQQSRPRSTVSDEANGLRISIRPSRDWAILFLVFWLAFWTYSGMHSWRTRIDHFSLFLLVWLFGELWVSYVILSTLGGRDIILAGSENLTRTKKIFGLGWSKTYPVGEIRNLRFQRGWNRRASRIAFEHRARTITFGKYIEEAEACELMRRIRQRCGIIEGSANRESGLESREQ
jgi:hypothetical protein